MVLVVLELDELEVDDVEVVVTGVGSVVLVELEVDDVAVGNVLVELELLVVVGRLDVVEVLDVVTVEVLTVDEVELDVDVLTTVVLVVVLVVVTAVELVVVVATVVLVVAVVLVVVIVLEVLVLVVPAVLLVELEVLVLVVPAVLLVELEVLVLVVSAVLLVELEVLVLVLLVELVVSGGCVVEVLVLGPGQPPPGQASQQFATVLTHALPPCGARHAAAFRLTLQRVVPLANVRQQETASAFPQTDLEAQRTTRSPHAARSEPSRTRLCATRATQWTYRP